MSIGRKPVYIDDQQRDLILTALYTFDAGIGNCKNGSSNLCLLNAADFTRRRLSEVIALFAIDSPVNKG